MVPPAPMPRTGSRWRVRHRRVRLGGVNDCGGYEAVWGVREGTWKEAFSGQDEPDCDSLRYFAIPVSFAGPCANEGGGFGPTDSAG